MMKKILFILAVLFVLFGMLAPEAMKEAEDDGLYIVTTTAQVGDLVHNIVGEHAKVEYLMGAGTDPHLYRPTRGDIAKLMQADIVFFNGMHLEGKMEHLLEQVAESKPAISIGNSLSSKSLNLIDEEEGYDPHIWMDVENWIVGANIVADILIEQDSERTESYNSNRDAYTEKLKELDKYAHGLISTIPKQQRILVTAHDAFGYLGSAYGLEVLGIQGISTESEAGLSKIEELVDLLVNREIKAVFFESSVGGHNIIAIIEGAKARGHVVNIGGSLFSDAMGTENTNEATYIGMMVYNLNTITAALGGAPDSVESYLRPRPQKPNDQSEDQSEKEESNDSNDSIEEESDNPVAQEDNKQE
ncbi:MAG: metal ABC transporter solute-binding protein, Zn/Mn family [Alphaproteobacteria bacterium]